MTALPTARAVLESGLAEAAYSAVSAEVGGSTGPLWRFAAGRLSFSPDADAADTGTIFDLASLTKVLSATSLVLRLAADRLLDVDVQVTHVIPEWRADDRRDVRVRDLLEHSSGLPAHREYFRRLSGREAYLEALCDEPLEYAPRTRSIYSDLGFMLLGVVIERLGGDTLDAQFERWRQAAGIRSTLAYLPPAAWNARVALTEDVEWRGRVLQGEVHDANAAALGGVAAHAGLFGDAAAVGDAARWWVDRLSGRDIERREVSAEVARAFMQRSTVPGSSRALGWDTMLPTSSCGTRLSPGAVGHTGFTGTSLWVDPVRDRYFVLLTNRVLARRDDAAIGRIRREFHDAAVADLEGG